MDIIIKPIAFVKNSRTTTTDDHWSEIISEIELAPHIPTGSFHDISAFSHLEIIFYFNQANPADIIFAGHPRGNTAYPFTGIFSQRKKDRPNSIGLCTVELIEQQERKIFVKNLDAINGTPVIDIKPVFREFLPKGIIRQPDWVSDLMKNYW